MSRKELENQMGSLREKHQRDAASLKSQLSEAESQAKDVQKEVTRNIISVLREFSAQWLLTFKLKEKEKYKISRNENFSYFYCKYFYGS